MAALGLAFAFGQLYLARLNRGQALAMATIVGLALLTLIGGYLQFLRAASIEISEAEVIAKDWLGRRRFRAPRGHTNLRLIAVKDMGISADFGVIWARATTGETSAVLLRRDVWGDRAFSELRAHLHGHSGKLVFRPVTKRALAEEFPHVHTQNLPAIAAFFVFLVALAVALGRQ